MELSHSFTVPASLDSAWEAFVQVDSLAACFPGATVTSVDGDDFTGNVKVKLGPISLLYSGTGTFIEKDKTAGRLVAEARGKDKRGNGTAGATITATIADAGDGATKVDVTTELQITGKPAQFGRGVIQDVSDKLLQQFVTCLQNKIGEPVAEPDVEPAAESTPAPESPTTVAAAMADTTSQPAALDVGATVLPVLLSTYRKQIAIALGALAAVLLLRRILR